MRHIEDCWGGSSVLRVSKNAARGVDFVHERITKSEVYLTCSWCSYGYPGNRDKYSLWSSAANIRSARIAHFIDDTTLYCVVNKNTLVDFVSRRRVIWDVYQTQNTTGTYRRQYNNATPAAILAGGSVTARSLRAVCVGKIVGEFDWRKKIRTKHFSNSKVAGRQWHIRLGKIVKENLYRKVLKTDTFPIFAFS